MRTDRRWPLAIAVALTLPLGGGATHADDDEAVVRWDIVNLPPFCPAPGGQASATAHHGNNSAITMTGSGTFEPDDPEEVTGGGTWTTFAPPPSNAVTGSGTYEVTELLSWHLAPGVLNCPNDTVPGQRAAGHAVLRIAYSDGSQGVLRISCRLGGTPGAVFEGIAASKGFVDYTHNVEPVGGVNANRTLFHIQGEEKDK